jgi:hypothetical protein
MNPVAITVSFAAKEGPGQPGYQGPGTFEFLNADQTRACLSLKDTGYDAYVFDCRLVGGRWIGTHIGGTVSMWFEVREDAPPLAAAGHWTEGVASAQYESAFQFMAA